MISIDSTSQGDDDYDPGFAADDDEDEVVNVNEEIDDTLDQLAE